MRFRTNRRAYKFPFPFPFFTLSIKRNMFAVCKLSWKIDDVIPPQQFSLTKHFTFSLHAPSSFIIGGDYIEERCSLDENSSGENYNNCTEEYSNECQNQYHTDNEYSNRYYNDGGHQQIAMNYSETPVQQPQAKGPEILYKSSKELYKAVAKECGITCKMTDTCR